MKNLKVKMMRILKRDFPNNQIIMLLSLNMIL